MMDLVTEHSELIKSLTLESTGGQIKLRRKDGIARLIGQPRIRLDTAELLPYLRKTHLTPGGDTLVPYVRIVGA